MSRWPVLSLVFKGFIIGVLIVTAYLLYMAVLKLAEPVFPKESLTAVELIDTSNLASVGAELRQEPEPDERILWKLFNNDKLVTLNKVIAQFRRKFPDWQPPAQLLSLLQIRQEHHDSDAIALLLPDFLADASVSSDNVNILIAQILSQPNHNCALLYSWHKQAVFQKIKNSKDRLKLFSVAILHCSSEHSRFSMLQIAQNYLHPFYFSQLIGQVKGLFFSPKYLQKVADLEYRHNRYYLSKALSNNEINSVEQLLSLFAENIIRYRDADTANHLGWYYLDHGNFLAAIKWFGWVQNWQPMHAESALGLVHALQQNQQTGRALAKAEQFTENAEMQVLLGKLLLAQANQLYEQGHYAKSRDFLGRARLYLKDSRLADELEAWLLLQTGNAQGALQIAQPYQKQSVAMQELARQVFLQRGWQLLEQKNYLLASRALRQAEAYLGKTAESEELRAWLNYHQRKLESDYSELFFRKEFLAANSKYRPDPVFIEQIKPNIGLLQNITTGAIEAGMIYRHKSGASGTSRLGILSAPVLGLHYTFKGRHELSFHMLRTDLTSGSLSRGCCVPLGSAGLAEHTMFTGYHNELANGLSFQLDYHKSGWFSPYASLGSTPTEGVVAPTVTWKLGFTQQWKRGFWGAEVFSRPIRQSILSYTGMRDPYSGLKWGRVSSVGGQLRGWYRFAKHWSLYTKFEGAFLHGVHVADNMHLSHGLSAAYDFNLAYFDYFNVGPALALEHYAKNLNHFTLGHGGYFSPQVLSRAGAEVNFLTEEGRSFIIKGRAGLGFQYFSEEQSPYFPRDPGLQAGSSLLYSKNSQAGFVFDAELKGVWLVHPNIQLAAGAAYRSINIYRDYFLGFNMRYYFQKRRASFSRDIPAFIFEQLF